MAGEYRIGLYGEDGKLIGYKADTFWSISTAAHAKRHPVKDGCIPSNLIGNLHKILTKTAGGDDGGIGSLVKAIAGENGERFFGLFETMLVGYDTEDEPVVFTHRVFPEGVEALSDEDKARLNAQPATGDQATA